MSQSSSPGGGSSQDARGRRHVYTVPPDEQGFGAYLRGLREQAGLTQVELAQQADLQQPQISAYERGVYKLPDPAALARLDDVFGLPRGTLLGRAGWQGATRRVESVPPAGSVVVPEAADRPLLAQLIPMLVGVSDDDIVSLIETVTFLKRTGSDESPDEDALSGDEGIANPA